MTATDFTTAAWDHWDSEDRTSTTPSMAFAEGANWARDHLAADIREAQAEAWDEGRLSGEFLGVHANPYREKEADHD